MRHILLLLMLALPGAFAQDYQKVFSTQSDFAGSITASLRAADSSSTYIPGLGYLLNLSHSYDKKTTQDIVTALTAMVPKLGTAIQGLGPNDAIWVSYRQEDFLVLVRWKAPAAPEVWVNGKKQ